MNGSPRVRAAIEEIVQKLVREYAPTKIILFGSHAYGEPDEDSDIDLLIIKETTQRLPERADAVRRVAQGMHPRIPFEPIVMTPAEVDERLEIGDQFVAEIIRRGEVLYAA